MNPRQSPFVRPSRLVLVLLSLVASVCAQAPTTVPPTTQATTQPTTQPVKTVRLLTIGNSFAINSTKFLKQLAQADNNQLILGQANVSGCSLERHWKAVEAYEADPASPAGKLYEPVKGQPKVSLRQMLERDAWDFVTIQQASPLSADPSTYEPYATRLVEYVRKHAPRAQVLIHQTWAYRVDHPRFRDGRYEANPEQMHDAVRKAYHALADRLDLRIIPVGDAMHLATHDPAWAYAPDPAFNAATATYPQVPPGEKRSLHVGWRWFTTRDGQRRLRFDGYHASVFGEYLGGCVFYEALFKESVIGNPYTPDSIPPQDAASLQALAHRAGQR